MWKKIVSKDERGVYEALVRTAMVHGGETSVMRKEEEGVLQSWESYSEDDGWGYVER